MPRKQYYYSAEQRAMRTANRRLRLASAKKNPDAAIYDERIVIRKTETATCQRAECGKIFSFVMTTKPHHYCHECKAIREQERSNRRIRTPRNDRLSARQVRYAGYDPSERELER